MSQGLEAEEEAVLVENGSFKIDRSRALEKLMRFQLPDPGMYLLMLARCAAASGASSFRADPIDAGRGIEARFDGKPFSADSLRFPYASLFSRLNDDVRRDRQLAIALMGLLRLGAKKVVIDSGIGNERVSLSVSSLHEEILEERRDGEKKTILRAFGGRSFWKKAHAEALRARCALSRVEIHLDGKNVFRGPDPQTPLDFKFDEDGARGWLSIPDSRRVKSTLKAYRFGVYAADVFLELPGAQVEAALNFDRFDLNASQSGLLLNSNFKKAAAVLRRAAEELTLREGGRQASRVEKMGRMLHDPILRRRWSSLLLSWDRGQRDGRVFSLLGEVFALGDEGSRRHLADCARPTAWLLRALLGCTPGMKKALWSAPLFYSTELKPLSLLDIEEQLRRIASVPIAKTADPDLKTAYFTVWIAAEPQKEVLELFFPGKIVGDGGIALPVRPLGDPSAKSEDSVMISTPKAHRDQPATPAKPRKIPKRPISRKTKERRPAAASVLKAVHPDSASSRLSELIRSLQSHRALGPLSVPEAGTVSFVSRKSQWIAPELRKGAWEIQGAHPWIQRILSSRLELELQAAYIASVAYSEANRREDKINNAEDSRFQAALIREAAQRCLEGKRVGEVQL